MVFDETGTSFLYLAANQKVSMTVETAERFGSLDALSEIVSGLKPGAEGLGYDIQGQATNKRSQSESQLFYDDCVGAADASLGSGSIGRK
jgi:hypothetical protein